MEEVKIEEWKKEIGYRETKEKCQECRFFREKENRYLDRSWIPCCLYAEKRFTGKDDEYGNYDYKVNPDGACNCFRKRLERCRFWQTTMCQLKKCKDGRYDDDCMEIDNEPPLP